MTLNFKTLHSGALGSKWVGRALAREAREEAGKCESCLLDLWVQIKGQDLFSMGNLLSAGSTAAPGEVAFLRHGWLSYASIWQRGVGGSKYFNWAKQIHCEFYIEALKKIVWIQEFLRQQKMEKPSKQCTYSSLEKTRETKHHIQAPTSHHAFLPMRDDK